MKCDLVRRFLPGHDDFNFSAERRLFHVGPEVERVVVRRDLAWQSRVWDQRVGRWQVDAASVSRRSRADGEKGQERDEKLPHLWKMLLKVGQKVFSYLTYFKFDLLTNQKLRWLLWNFLNFSQPFNKTFSHGTIQVDWKSQLILRLLNEDLQFSKLLVTTLTRPWISTWHHVPLLMFAIFARKEVFEEAFCF